MAEILAYFLRLGCTGFGGPLALVAQMQTDLIDERKWISRDEYVQALALIKSMPGPLAFATAAYMGTRRGGFWGGTLAGWALVLPAGILMLILAQLYDRYSDIVWVSKGLNGMQAAALALIVLSIRSLVKGYERKWLFWFLCVAALALTIAHVPEPVVILGFGLLAIAVMSFGRKPFVLLSWAPLLALDPRIPDLIKICFKSGALVFGTGLAMIPILETDFVTKTHWLTQSEFMTALAFGQMTPGPVLITVTFVGFKVAGYVGAVAATVAVFFPSYVHMTTWFPRLVGWLSRQGWVSKFILGALAAVVATLVLTTYKLCSSATVWQNFLMVGFILISLRWKMPSWMLIAMGAVAGIAIL